ncbi:MAG: branched-chain amino acid ABC transporter permease [Candidatus Andersenbacteria bacterium]|nr:branched-chain amino acid ABC transporter permease [Candidatus Andersenbacteria bacterium]
MLAPYVTHILILIGIYAMLAMSLNLTIGFTGLLNLGHVAFFGIGAYTSALLTLVGVPFPLALLAAGLIASVFGLLLMSAVRQIKGDYLALVTLGFSFVVYSVFLNWTGLTRGPLGIPGIPKPSLFGLAVTSNQGYLLLVVIAAILSGLFLWRLTRSRFGRVLAAVRDDELAASVLGKPVFKMQVYSMMVASFVAGLAGSLFAHYLTYIDPSSFFLSEIILILTIVIVGGLASLRGSVVAAAIILVIPEILRFVGLPSAIVGPLRQILYAALLIGVLMIKPRGLFGQVDLT